MHDDETTAAEGSHDEDEDVQAHWLGEEGPGEGSTRGGDSEAPEENSRHRK